MTTLKGGKTMVRWKRVIAFILTVILAVHGLPVFPAAQAAIRVAEEIDSPMQVVLGEEELSNARMRFVQTGFKPATSSDGKRKVAILTMSLQIKPDPGETVQEGMFVFQTDASRVIPITRPQTGTYKAIRAFYGQIAAVVTDTNNKTTMSESMYDFLHPTAGSSKASLISTSGSGGFQKAMSTTDFLDRYTGYLVSGERADNWDEETSAGTRRMLDCYFQFYFNHVPDVPVLDPDDPDYNDGYVNVIDLDFEVYAGDTGVVTPENVLFGGLIRVPETAAEAQEIVDQFKYTDASGAEVSLASGGAGFIQTYEDEYEDPVESKAYYYYNEPKLTKWRQNWKSSGTGFSRTKWSQPAAGGNPTALRGEVPGLWYENMESLYRLESLSLEVANIFGYENDPNAEFFVPQNSDVYPRYNVPTYQAYQDNLGKSFQPPEVYLGKGKRTALKYYLSPNVSENSLSSPQSDKEGETGVEGLRKFVEGLKWEFLLDVNEEMSSLDTFSIDNIEMVDDTHPDYIIKEATLADSRLKGTKLLGKKLWVLYRRDDPTQEFMRVPVGVTLEMVDSTIYYDDPQNPQTDEDGEWLPLETRIPAPQFNVSYEAANPNNFIWNVGVGSKDEAILTFHAVFEPEDRNIASDKINISLHIEKSVPSQVAIHGEDYMGKVLNGEEPLHVGTENVDGTGAETSNDAVERGDEAESVEAGEAAVVHAALYDQYHSPYHDIELKLEVVPTEATKRLYDEADKACPFQVIKAPSNSTGDAEGEEDEDEQDDDAYTIIYSGYGTTKKTVNDAVAGEHILRATYSVPGKTVKSKDYTITIEKPADRLSYVRTVVSSGTTQSTESKEDEKGVSGTLINVTEPVPYRNALNQVVTTTEQISITELANQWRNPTMSVDDVSLYDLVPGLRDEEYGEKSGLINMTTARSKGINISFEADSESLPYGVALDRDFAKNGIFTYDTNTLDGSQLRVKLNVSYGGESRFVEYLFRFTREPVFLQEIKILPPEGEDSYHVAVPYTDVEAGFLDYELDIRPYDQYGTMWDWTAVDNAYGPGGRLSQAGTTEDNYVTWTVYAAGSGLPEGVSLVGRNGKTVRVTSAAKISQFTVYATFSGITSNPMVIYVERETGRPTVVKNLAYGRSNEITPPNRYSVDEAGNPEDGVYPPAIEVYDQYFDLMKAEDYSATYTMSPVSAYVSIDRSTGVLTVKNSAPDLTFTVTAVIRDKAQSGVRHTIEAKVNIKRDPANPEAGSIQVSPGKVTLPSINDDVEEVMTELKASGKTQYEDNQVFQVTWMLESVEFQNGSVLNRTSGEGEDAVVTGEIPLENGNTYNAGNMVYLSSKGVLRFGALTSEDRIPKKLKVKVLCSNGVTGEGVVEVIKNPSVPTEIYFPGNIDAYIDGVQVPDKTVGEVTVPLIAYVRDQYRMMLTDKEVTWSYDEEELPAGVTVDLTSETKTVTITSAAEQKPIILTARYDDVKNEYEGFESVDGTLTIPLWLDQELVPDEVRIDAGENFSTGKEYPVIDRGGVREMMLPLPVKPAATGDGQVLYTGSELYLMKSTVLDQYGNPIPRSVTWSVKNVPNGAKIHVIDTGSGRVRLYYPESDAQQFLKDVENGKMSFTLHVDVRENGVLAASDDVKVTLSLEDSVPSYAVPVMIDAGADPDEATGDPTIPAKGDPERRITVGATVYDQYGQPMEGEQADLWLETADTGLSFTEDNNNQGTLFVRYNVLIRTVSLKAAPGDNQRDKVRAESGLLITLSGGTRYPEELFMERYDDTVEVPYWGANWDPVATVNVPGPDSVKEYVQRAEVVDQNGVWLSTFTQEFHPIWEFEGDHTNVKFNIGDEDGDDVAEYEDVSLVFDNRVMAANETLKTVTLKLYTTGQDRDEKFSKTFTLALTKEKSAPTYLFFAGANEKGENAVPMARPTTKEGSAVYTLEPELYDQYGFSLDGSEIRMDLDRGPLESMEDILVEEVYREGESAENGDSPIGCRVYRVHIEEVPKEEDPENPEEETEPEQIVTRTLLAEFEYATGELTVHNECDLDGKLVLVAKHPTLGEKKLTVRIAEDPRRLDDVGITRTVEEFAVRGNEEPIEDPAYPTAYDQYGDAYPGNVSFSWKLVLPETDENGNHLPYEGEYDRNGNELPMLVTLPEEQEGDGRSTVVTVHPRNYRGDKIVLLECTVIDENDPDTAVKGYSEIHVYRPRRSGGPAGVTVYFDAGEFGKLVGESEIVVESGSAPENPPGVKTEEGYGFVGWTSDGVLVVDASKVEVVSDVSYTAVYKNITNTKFLEGYGDHTIRPQQHITRAEFVSMVVRALGGFQARANYGSFFTDVPDDAWYASAVSYAKLVGIIDGYGDGTFRPGAPITRAEATRILADAAQVVSGKEGTFSDVKPEKWYSKYIEALAEAGVADGYEDGTYRPGKPITRAESVKLIVMITTNSLNELELSNIQKYAYCPFTDIYRGHWAYAYILRAAGIA